MLYCEQCKTEINGNHTVCPLCQCSLKGTPEEYLSDYPLIMPHKSVFDIAPKIMRFVAVFSCVVCVLINYVTYNYTMWSAFVVGGIACGWIAIKIGVPMRANLIKGFQIELYIICVLSVIWDYATGWRGWSISIVIPIATAACMVIMNMLAILLNKHTKEYLIYLVMVDLVGFATAIILFIDSIEIKLPAVVCVGTSCAFLARIIFFERKTAVKELKKKLHM